MSTAAEADLLLSAGKYAEAIEAYTRAIQDSKSSPDYHLQRSIAYHKSKIYSLALEDSEKAISLAVQRGNKSTRAKAQFRRALALQGLRRYRDALACIDFATQDGCTDKALEIWRDKIKQTCETNDQDESKGVTSIFREDSAAGQADAAQSVASASAEVQTSQPEDNTEVQLKHEWYQSSDRVVLTLYARNVSPEGCQITFSDDSVSVRVAMPGTNKQYNRQFSPLSESIDAVKSSYRVLSTKVEIVLIKVNPTNWPALERSDRPIVKPIAYPTSSHSGPKNWDKLAGEEDTAVEPEGDAALTHLFQTLYKDADEDTKKAMIKSYTESGGTALSTDWKSVQKEKVKVSPPEGMEARKYEA